LLDEALDVSLSFDRSHFSIAASPPKARTACAALSASSSELL